MLHVTLRKVLWLYNTKLEVTGCRKHLTACGLDIFTGTLVIVRVVR